MFPIHTKIDEMMDHNWTYIQSRQQIPATNNKDCQTYLLEESGQYELIMHNNQQRSETTGVVIRQDASIEEIASILAQHQPCIVIDEDEQVKGVIHLASFSSELFQQYRQLEAYLQTILNTIDESCTVIDHKKRVLIWTKGAEKIFSVKASEILGKPITDFFKSDQLEILNALEHGTHVTHHQHHARNDLVVLINSNPVTLDDDIIGAVVSESDITNQIRLNNELFSTSEKLFNLEEEMRKSGKKETPFSNIRGNSPALKKTLTLAEKAATTDASVLIYGESGVGKELFAKALHYLRETEKAPFIALNCGAIPSGLFESEIFGYEKGAFSGADQKGKKGKVELAKNGTLFLDEIGEMTLEMQVKFLRLLQEKKFYRVGGTQEIEVDFRIIAATNKDLKQLVEEGKFREDLYYRLNVVNLTVPPLRERPEDIIELTHYFLYDISKQYNKPIHGISQNLMQHLLEHDWPGNIRELKNVVERLIVFSENGEIQLEHLPFELNDHPTTVKANDTSVQSSMPNIQIDDDRPLKERLEECEKIILLEELKKVGGNKQQCAQNLHITRATLYNRLKRLGIDSSS